MNNTVPKYVIVGGVSSIAPIKIIGLYVIGIFVDL